MSGDRFAYLGEIVSRRPFLVAIAAAVAAMLFAAGFLRQREALILRVSEPVNAVVAAHDLRAGELVDEDSVLIQKIPRRYLEPGAVADIPKAAGRIAAIYIRRDAQVTDTNTRPASAAMSVAPLIPAGRRAVSLALDEAGGVANLLRPNDTVDVIATFDLGNDVAARRTTLTIADNLQVLAVGKEVADSVQRDAEENSKAGIFGRGAPAMSSARMQTSVTLAASPAEAQKILFAGQSGAVSLALRPFGDDGTIEDTAPTTISTITGGHEELLPARRGYREYKGK